jgi:hypothetical protein
VVLLGGIYFRFASKEGKLSLGKAMDHSFRQFLPLDLPGPKWEPSQPSPAAAMLKICGWFLVPILVLTVIEFVRRTPKVSSGKGWTMGKVRNSGSLGSLGMTIEVHLFLRAVVRRSLLRVMVLVLRD